MLGSVVLLLAASSSLTRRLEACLRAAGNDVCVSSDPSRASLVIGARAVDLVVADAALLSEHALESDAPTLLYSTGVESLESLLAHGSPYFVGLGDAEQAAEGVRNVARMAERILRRDFFGLDKYMQCFGIEMVIDEIRGASERDAHIKRAASFAKAIGARRRDLSAVTSIVDELVTNAIYDAPIDLHGEHKYAHVDRRTKVELAPHEVVSLAYGSDGYTFAISVTDNFGSLPVDRICSRLLACMGDDGIEQKAGGAGIGMHAVLSQCDELIINVEPGVRTEIIALIDLARVSKTPRGTLHVSSVQAVPDERDVVLSQGLRLDLCAEISESKRRRDHVSRVSRKAAAGTNPPKHQPSRLAEVSGTIVSSGEVWSIDRAPTTECRARLCLSSQVIQMPMHLEHLRYE